MIVKFLRWWLNELTLLVPESLRLVVRPRRPLLRIELTNEGMHVYTQLNDKVNEFGHISKTEETEYPHEGPMLSGDGHYIQHRISRLDPAHTQVTIAVSPDLGLSKELELPLPTEENLEQVMSFQVERETPFRRDDVYFDYQVLDRDKQRQRIKILFHVIPRHLVQEALALVRNWDVRSVQGKARTRINGWLELHFLSRRYNQHGAIRLQLGLVTLNILLVVMVVAISFIRQGRDLYSLQSEFEEVQSGAAKSIELRDRISRIESEMQSLVELKLSRPAMVVMLEELSVLLPDTTWLYQLEAKGDEVNLQGISDSASSLVSILESSHMFHNTRFAASVTQDRQKGSEQFRLTVDIERKKSIEHKLEE